MDIDNEFEGEPEGTEKVVLELMQIFGMSEDEVLEMAMYIGLLELSKPEFINMYVKRANGESN